MSSEAEDGELVRRFLELRSEESFQSLYRHSTPPLYLFALRLAGGLSHDAEDVVQETWLRVIRNLAQFRLDTRFRTWLCGIALNCYREIQRNRRQLMQQVSHSTNPHSGSGDLEQLIRMLPDGHREILILHDLYGYTHAEIAAQLQIHEGTSKSQLFEARKKLRAQMKQEKS